MQPAPALSIVVADRGGTAALPECIAALAGQRDDAEVIACLGGSEAAALQAAHPWLQVIERHGALVPELWREGIDAARGEAVALTIGAMVPDPGWAAAARAGLDGAAAVAGAIEPGPGLRRRDLAEYLCRYSHDMLPFEEHDCGQIPGDNCAYRLAPLRAVRSFWSDGFWEPEVNRELAGAGERLLHTPGLVVRMGRSAGLRAFVRQRLVHGRAHGRQRGARFGATRNLAGIAAAPLVVPLLALRSLRASARAGRLGSALRVLPELLLFDAAWAAGEAAGHLDVMRAR